MQIVDAIDKNKEEFREKIIEAKENKEMKKELEQIQKGLQMMLDEY